MSASSTRFSFRTTLSRGATFFCAFAETGPSSRQKTVRIVLTSFFTRLCLSSSAFFLSFNS
uniref:Uncharacterized protein n=1 Tax=Arundo donax TaxID=35708 RepID=A0A0A9CLG9_ARUDO